MEYRFVVLLLVSCGLSVCSGAGGITFKKAYKVFLTLLEKGTSLDEFIAETFPDSDYDGDGFSTLPEAKRFYKEMDQYRNDVQLKFKFKETAEQLFRPVDANSDGKITTEEFSKFMKGNKKPYFVLVGFRHFDANKDGKLNGEELITVKNILSRSGADVEAAEKAAKAN